MSAPVPITLVTGASGGIGAALARVFAQNGHRLVLVARREVELVAVAQRIALAGVAAPIALPMDLGAPGACDRLAEELGRRGLEPGNVVNSAGYGLLGTAATLDRGEQLSMIDLNVRVLTDLSLRWTDALARHRGGVLNVGSITGFYPGPAMAVYHATKAYVLSFGEALHHELKPKGVRVTTLCPGPAATEFMARAGVNAGDYPALMVHSAGRIARDGYDGFMAGRCLVVTGWTNKAVKVLPRLLPRGWVLKIAGFSQSGRRKALRR